MATNATDAPTAHGSTTAAPILSAPKGSLAARLRPASYFPEPGTAAAWDAAQWRYALCQAEARSANSAADRSPNDDTRARREAADAAEDEAHQALIDMSAPHMQALLWKLLFVLTPDSDGFSHQWSAQFLQPIVDDAMRLSATSAQRTRLHSEWTSARALYIEAREGEMAAGAANDVAGEERWTKRRFVAEDALMATPSPDAAAFAFKYVVAHGNGRETDDWNDMLEAEAVRFAQEEA